MGKIKWETYTNLRFPFPNIELLNYFKFIN